MNKNNLPFNNLSLTTIPGEEWKYIKNADNYMVSNLGRVKSLERTFVLGVNNILVHEKILKQNIVKNKNCNCATLRVYIKFNDNKWKSKTVAQLVLSTFCTKTPLCNWTHHLNLNSYDNRLCNLTYTSRSRKTKIEYIENVRHSYWTKENFKLPLKRKRILSITELNKIKSKKRKKKIKDVFYEVVKNIPITVYTKTTDSVRTYTSIRDAARHMKKDATYLAKIRCNTKDNVAIQIKNGILTKEEFDPIDYKKKIINDK